MNTKYINRIAAKELGLKTYISGTTCKQGHTNAERYTTSSTCVICRSSNKRTEEEKVRRRELDSRSEIKEKNKKKCKKYYHNNKEHYSNRMKEYYQTKKEDILRVNREYYQTNKETILEQKRKYGQENRDKVCAKSAAKRAAKLQRFPSWADKALIDTFYKEAKRLTKETGIEHHVDHIIPLQGELVSGLHIYTNLRVIPASENLSKNNKFEII